MKLVSISAILALSLSANAKLLESDSQTVTLEIKSAVFEVMAKCIGPKFEDDAFQTYFSEESYQEVAEYLQGGYSMKLLDKSCGYEDTGKPQLSYDEYEKVKVYFVDGNTPRQTLSDSIKDIWEAKD